MVPSLIKLAGETASRSKWTIVHDDWTFPLVQVSGSALLKTSLASHVAKIQASDNLKALPAVDNPCHSLPQRS